VRHHPFLCAFLLVPLVFFAAGCDDNNDVNTPTTPPPSPITENFEGHVTVNGAVTHPFTVTAPSTITATLVAVSSGADTVVGMALGTWNGENCQIIITNDAAVQGKFIVGIAQTAGTFCVRFYDVGQLTQAIDYQATVSHQ
jgi:hypothetical protein